MRINKTNRNGYHGSKRGSTTSTPTARPSKMAPIQRRVRSIVRPVAGSFQPAEAALAGGIIAECLVQRRTVELRPALFRHPKLSVRDLPQQKIAYPHFARRTNQ